MRGIGKAASEVGGSEESIPKGWSEAKEPPAQRH